MPYTPQSPIPRGRAKAGGTTYYTVPGVGIGGTPTAITTFALTAAFLHYMPFLVETPITIDQLTAEITTQASAGNKMRMGIYTADTDWQPTGLVVDGGEVAIDALGQVTATISVTLAPGRYLLASLPQANCSVRSWYGTAPYLGIKNTLSTNSIIGELFASQSYGALPAGPAWTAGFGGNGLLYHVLCRVSTP